MSTYPSNPAPYPVVVVPQAVVVTDIDMSIGAMCRFMVKWVIAAIPAAIILWILFMAFLVIFALLFGGMLQGLPGLQHRF